MRTFHFTYFIYLPWHLYHTPFVRPRHWDEGDPKMNVNSPWLMNEPWTNCSDDLTGSGADGDQASGSTNIICDNDTNGESVLLAHATPEFLFFSRAYPGCQSGWQSSARLKIRCCILSSWPVESIQLLKPQQLLSSSWLPPEWDFRKHRVLKTNPNAVKVNHTHRYQHR